MKTYRLNQYALLRLKSISLKAIAIALLACVLMLMLLYVLEATLKSLIVGLVLIALFKALQACYQFLRVCIKPNTTNHLKTYVYVTQVSFVM